MDTKIERDDKGQFALGNSGGPGRPRRQTEREYLSAMGDVCCIEDWQEIVKRAVADGKAGDGKARQWLSNYLIGPRKEGILETIAVDEITWQDPVKREVKFWDVHKGNRETMKQILTEMLAELEESADNH